MKVTVRVENQQYEVEIVDLYARPVIAVIGGQRFEVWPELSVPCPEPTSAPVPQIRAASTAPAVVIAKEDAKAVYAPIPGVIVAVSVEPGAQVEVGQEICILEAMKMKNVIRAPRTGTVATIKITTGQHVKHHDLLIEYAE